MMAISIKGLTGLDTSIATALENAQTKLFEKLDKPDRAGQLRDDTIFQHIESFTHIALALDNLSSALDAGEEEFQTNPVSIDEDMKNGEQYIRLKEGSIAIEMRREHDLLRIEGLTCNGLDLLV